MKSRPCSYLYVGLIYYIVSKLDKYVNIYVPELNIRLQSLLHYSGDSVSLLEKKQTCLTSIVSFITLLFMIIISTTVGQKQNKYYGL